MFVGHYAIGFLLKKRFEKIPLWILFIAVQFVDIVAFTLILLGIEKISYNPSTNPFLRTKLEYVPLTHSLSSNLIIAFIVVLIFWKLKNKVWGIVLGGAVLSHWFLDFIVHKPDLPLISNSFKVGLGLWHYSWIAFLLEIGLFIVSGYYLYKDSKNNNRLIILIILAVILYTPTMFAPQQEVSTTIVSIISISMFTLFTFLAFWKEKIKK